MTISLLQECFVEALKLNQAYQVIREVFLGFRVLILRMSPGTFTPLWPIMLNGTSQICFYLNIFKQYMIQLHN